MRSRRIRSPFGYYGFLVATQLGMTWVLSAFLFYLPLGCRFCLHPQAGYRPGYCSACCQISICIPRYGGTQNGIRVEGVALGEREVSLWRSRTGLVFHFITTGGNCCGSASNLACSFSPDRHCTGFCIYLVILRRAVARRRIRFPAARGGMSHRNDMGKMRFCVAMTCVYLSSESTSLRSRTTDPNLRHFQARFSRLSAGGKRKVYV